MSILKRILAVILIIAIIIPYEFCFLSTQASAVSENFSYTTGAMDKLSSLYFENDTQNMTTKLYTYLDTVYKEMTRTDYTTGSIIKHIPTIELNNKTCIEMPITLKIIETDGSTRGFFNNLNNLSKLKAGEKIRIKLVNSTKASVYEVKGNGDIDKLKKGMLDFIIRVRQVMLEGLLSQSIVIMGSSTNSVGRLSEIMEKGEDNTYDFTAKFKANMLFTPNYILHPITGKVESVNSFIEDCETLLYTGFYNDNNTIKKSTENKYFNILSVSKDEVVDREEKTIAGLVLHADYVTLLENPKEYLQNYNAIDSSTNAFDFTTFPCQHSRVCNNGDEIKVVPNYFMSYIYPLAVPDNYTQSGGNSQIYRMQNFPNDTPKYLCIDDIAINVKTSMVYSYDGLIYTTIGDFSDFGFQRENIYIHMSLKSDCSFEQYSQVTSEEAKAKLCTGVAVCGNLYEGVWDTTELGDDTVEKPKLGDLVITEINKEGGLYLTGRKVIMGIRYTSDMPFNILTSNTLQFDENGRMSKTCAKFFAFAHDVVSAKERNQHKRTLDTSIRFQAYFLNIPPTNGEQGVYGICLVRNNYYATDTSLVNWLSSDAAKGIPYVKAEELLKLLTSSSTAENNILSYEDFTKMEAIREKLEHYHDNDIYSFVHKVIIILGFLIVFYGAILLLAFFFDLYDIGFNINLLGKLTFGKLKACSMSDYEYVANSTDYVYVTWKKILLRVFACFFIGLFLVEYETLITYIIFIYQYFMDLAGIM